jgi:hypothetical protein
MGYVMNFDVLFYYIVLSISIMLLLSCRCRKVLEVPSSHPEEMNLSLEPSPFLGILCPCLHHHILISKLSLYCLKKRSCVMENPQRTGWPPCVLFVAPKVSAFAVLRSGVENTNVLLQCNYMLCKNYLSSSHGGI